MKYYQSFKYNKLSDFIIFFIISINLGFSKFVIIKIKGLTKIKPNK